MPAWLDVWWVFLAIAMVFAIYPFLMWGISGERKWRRRTLWVFFGSLLGVPAILSALVLVGLWHLFLLTFLQWLSTVLS
jgi:hypothetical protein